jgi:hypothetical protein
MVERRRQVAPLDWDSAGGTQRFIAPGDIASTGPAF